MDRTTIILPPSLKAGLMRRARSEGVSFAELLRRALGKYLVSRGSAGEDSFLSSSTVFEDDGPRDVSLRHDAYLIGKTSSRIAERRPPRKKRHG